MSRVRLMLSESLRSLGANLSTTVAATMTVLIGMFLLGLFIGLGTWVVSWSDHIKAGLVVKVFFADDANVNQINTVRMRLESDARIKPDGVVFVSKAEALKEMQRKYPDLTENLPGNPLPASFRIIPKRGEEGGFVYDADAYNDDLPYFVEVKGKRHLIVPYSFTYNDGRYVLPQGFGSPSDFFDLCRRGLDELRREGHAGYPKMMSIGLHPRWAGQAGRTSALRELIEYALEQGDVWFARRIDIANWWREHHEEFER